MDDGFEKLRGNNFLLIHIAEKWKAMKIGENVARKIAR